MADERAARLLLRFETSKADIDRTKKELTAMERGFESWAEEVRRLDSALLKQVTSLQKSTAQALVQERATRSTAQSTTTLTGELAKLDRSRALMAAAESAAKLRKETGDAEKAVAQLNAELMRMKATSREVEGAAAAFDSYGSAAGGKSGRNALQRFGVELRAMPAVPLAGNLSTDVFAKMITVLGGLNPVVLGVIGAVGGLIVGLNQLASSFGQTITSLINSQEEYYRALKTGTSESIKETITTKQLEVDILKARTKEYQDLFTQFEQQAGTVGRGIADALNIGNAGTLRKELQDLEAKLRDEEFALGRLNNALGSTDVANNDLAASEAELAAARAKAVDVIAGLRQQRAQLEADYEDRALDAFIDRAISERRANEDLTRGLEKQRQDHLLRLEDIEAAGLDRIAGLRDQGVKRLTQFDQQTGAIQDRLVSQINSDNDRLRKLNADYMRGEVAAVDKYRDEEAKRTRDYNKERVRLLEDLNTSLLDAQESNDVVAFIQAQRAGELRLQRQAEDASDEDKERAARFDAERKETAARRDERITELRAEATERQRAIQEELTARQTARQEILGEIAAAVEVEKTRIQEQRKAQQDAYDERQRLDAEEREIRAKRAQEDQALRESREREALDKQISNINWRVQMEADAAKLIVDFGQNGARIIGEAHVSMANAVARSLSQTAQSIANGGTPIPGVLTWAQRGNINWNLPSGGSSRSMVAFAGGGVVDRPTFGMFGERPGYAEAFIPFRKSEGLEAALAKMGMGGQSVNFNAPITVGDGVSQQQVKAAMTEAVMGLLDGLTMARGVA